MPPLAISPETTFTAPGSAEGFSVCLLASGSKGNAIFISDGHTSILLDAGLSGKAIEARLAQRGLQAANLDAIVVSHEHSDHIRGVGVLSRRHGLPVYISPATRQAAPQLGRLHQHHLFEVGTPFEIQTLCIHPFATSHDAADPAGFTIAHNGLKVGIATDLGIATAMVKERLKAVDLLILEANHDLRMLHDGPYPWPLKQRIKGRNGHLSNEDSRDLLADLIHAKLRHVVLAHLSETNNHPHLARKIVGPLLERGKIPLTVSVQA
ncbi:MAG: MBL fold metallo-hydrolase, partial [Desulfobacterales bacterium]